MGDKILESKYPLPVIIRDSREHDEAGYRYLKCDTCNGTVESCLKYGDYAVSGFPDLIVIERKASITELCGNLGKHRERFERELQGIVDAGIKFRYVIIEDYVSSIDRPRFTRMPPQAILGSIVALQLKYSIPFIFVGTKKAGHKYVRALLLKAYDYRMKGIV